MFTYQYLPDLRTAHLGSSPVLSCPVYSPRLLQGVVERASSCHDQRQQACLRLEDLRGQAAALPRLFLWPGAMERQQAAERARALLERTKVLGPALSALRAQRKELVHLTQDPSWMDPSWAVLEDGAPELIRELNVRTN